MAPTFIFFDHDLKMVKDYKSHLEHEIPEAQFINCSVEDLYADIYVSPANGFGFMAGGIDGYYSKIFPNVQDYVQQEISKISREKTSGKYPRNYLSVGSAIIANTGTDLRDNQNKKVICSPTMKYPSHIQDVSNIYYVMIAIFNVCAGLDKNIKVAIPGMGTGVGGVIPRDCANQTLLAYRDFSQNKTIKYPENINISKSEGVYYVYPSFIH